MAQPIRNTADQMRDPIEASMFLLNQLGSPDPGNPGPAIMAMESEGQRQLVNSDRLPTRADDGDEAYLALGFTFGEPDKGDALFRPATLPAGWKREGSDHAMWSYIADQHGRHRVAIFYKAAFYDRSAFMRLESRYGYLSNVLYDNGRPVLDDEWLTAAICRDELEAIAVREDEEAVKAENYAASPGDEYWSTRAAEHRADAAKARALAESLS